jgi:carboxymethylenebutenolidase
MRATLPSGTPVEIARPVPGPADRTAPGSPTGLVIAPDIFGLRPLFDDLTQRMADEGFVAVAVEPFPGQDLPDVDARFAAVPGLDDDAVIGDLCAAADLTGCDRVGLIGFCMGGMYAHKAAGIGRFARIVSVYGMIRLPLPWRGPAQQEPLRWLDRPGASPVLAIIGERDPYTPPDDVAELATRPNVEIAAYPEAEHGFVHDPSRPSHRPADAADAWARALAFLRS